jgi:hypothetical protein
VSHITTTRLEITDFQALIDALRDNYGEVVEVHATPQVRKVAYNRYEAVHAYVPETAFASRWGSGIGVRVGQGGRIDLLVDSDDRDAVVPAIRRAYALRVADADLTASGFVRAAADETLQDGTVRRVYTPADGAPAPRVVVTVEPNGTVRITVEGMIGMGCLPITAGLIARLGGAAETTLTADAYGESADADSWAWAKERNDA